VGSEVLKPVVLVALVAVLGYTLRTPSLGEVELLRLRPARNVRRPCSAGPGSASTTASWARARAASWSSCWSAPSACPSCTPSATSKIVNTATNLAALLLFAAGGHVLWALGAAMAACNVAGSSVGARLAIRRGSAWVRRVFIVVVGALVLRLAYDVLG
jgi:uncharacterized membrane protein YfcA